ncbi:MAG: hypothetical protein ACSHX9_07145 [Luteolibacter sp.]
MAALLARDAEQLARALWGGAVLAVAVHMYVPVVDMLAVVVLLVLAAPVAGELEVVGSNQQGHVVAVAPRVAAVGGAVLIEGLVKKEPELLTDSWGMALQLPPSW